MDNAEEVETPDAPMSSPSQLFRLLNEIALFLLGALLVLLSISQRIRPPRQPSTWILLGIILIYWGARAGMRWTPPSTRWPERLRGASFILAGAVILNIAILPYRFAPAALGIAGGILAVRGLVNAVAFTLTQPAREVTRPSGGP
ncbi:MAG: hypothetical protein WA755_09585 [Candidatus Acidiferrales bacterium]